MGTATRVPREIIEATTSFSVGTRVTVPHFSPFAGGYAATFQHRNPVHVHPALPSPTIRQSGPAKLTAIVIFILVKNLKYLRRLAETVQFTRYKVLRTTRRSHSGIPADTI